MTDADMVAKAKQKDREYQKAKRGIAAPPISAAAVGSDLAGLDPKNW